MTGSSKDRQYARFVPREEVSRVTGWEFMEVDEALRQASLRSAAPVVDPELLQRTHDEAFAQGLEQGRREAALEVQHYVHANMLACNRPERRLASSPITDAGGGRRLMFRAPSKA